MTMKAVQSVSAILLALAIVSFSQAETIYVDEDNVAGPWDGTPEHPYQHIQDGIDAASNGDTVLVRDGMYKGAGNVNLDFHGKAITVRSEDGPDNCIIDCEKVVSTRGFYFHSGEGPDSVVDGLTIQNGSSGFWPDDRNGGGIYCRDNSSPTIRNNIITKNWATFGSGIYCDSSSPMIANNMIIENWATDGGGILVKSNSSPEIMNNSIAENIADEGGGIYCVSSSPMIKGNIITENVGFDCGGGGIYCDSSTPAIVGNTIAENSGSTGEGAFYGFGGGGIACHSGSSAKITDNVIIGNWAGFGGGIHCNASSAIVANNTVVGNMGGGGAGICCYWNSYVTVTNTILWENRAYVSLSSILVEDCWDPVDSGVYISHSNVQGGLSGCHGPFLTWGPGNMDAVPLFVDAANGDYHLRGSSPCMGRGITSPDVPDEDIEGNPRPNPPGSNPDIGAYENSLPAPSVSSTLIIQAFSPVDLVVTDPKLRTISKDASTIPYAVYIQTDSNGDGDPDDTVVILDALLGNYIIQVLPEPGASPADTYTLDISYGDETVRLAENVSVQDIPADPYIFFYPLLDMKQGWNLISLPLEPPDADPGAVLSSISGSYNSVWAFEPGAGWTVYAPGVPIGLERMEPDRGYWIKMDERGSLIVQGEDPEQTDISLRGGEWNLVGYSSRTSRNAENCMSQVEDSINSVWEYDAKDETWFIYMPGGPSNLEVMRPGVGYWMKADQECVWDINATTQLAAPALALKSGRGFASADRPEIPYMVWGSVEIDGVKVTGKDTTYHTPIAVTLEIDGEVQYSCILRASKQCGDFYVLHVPSYMDGSAQPELYVRMDGNIVKTFPIPMGRSGEIIRFDLSIRIAPKVSLLRQNYPNPFNPDTWIPYQLREDNDVVIMIYASTGRLARTLDLGRKPAGFYTDREKAAYWDGKNEAGEYVASGVYFYSIKAGDLTATRKMVIVR
jgi:hypothetical protein